MDFDIVSVFVVSSSVIVLLVLAVVMFVLFYQKRLLAQKMKVRDLEHEHRLKLLRATIETQEREQMRLAKDLHDGVGALLTATKLQVQQVERQLEDNDSAAPFVALTNEMLEESIATVRAVARNLVPPTLERFGLADALTTFAEKFSAGGKITVSVTANAPKRRYESNTELALFRVVQELVNNTAKHSNATEARVELNANGKSISLTYQDNGSGFDVATIEPGLGLKSLESRVNMLGGKLKLEPGAGSGFSAAVTVPATAPKTETTST